VIIRKDTTKITIDEFNQQFEIVGEGSATMDVTINPKEPEQKISHQNPKVSEYQSYTVYLRKTNEKKKSVRCI